MDWENHLEKNPIQTIEKNGKNQSEIAACEQKKENFCSNTVFSLYLKNRGKKTRRFFAPLPVSGDQNHYSNLTSKIMKICE